MKSANAPHPGPARLAVLEAFVRASPEAVMVLEGRPLDEPGPPIVLVSDVFTRLTGYRADDVIGRDPRFLLGPLSDRDTLRRLRQAMEAWQPAVGCLVHYHKDGSPFTAQVQLLPVVAGHGPEFTHYVALHSNVTEIDRTSRLLAQMAATARVGGWEVDLASQRVYWTDETYRITDTTPASFSPSVEGGIAFYTPACQPIVREAVRRAIDEGTPFDLELDLITARGRELRVRAVGEADREAGRTVRLHGSIQDVTTTHRAHQEREQFLVRLQQTQKLESLGVLAGGIAHDFNNLLTGTLGFAELAHAALDPASTPAGYLDRVIASVERAADLCRQMLAYAGKGRLTMEPMSLNRVINEARPLLHLSVSKRAVLTVSLPPDLPNILGDAAQLGQVIVNLVINASEALGDAGGSIALRTSLASDDPTLPGDHVCLEVSDTGCGMDDATLARIFEPFFSTKFTGRGLGLAAVQGIIRRHRGTLRVSSRVGAGTTFRAYFPVTDEPVRPDQPVEAVGGYRGEGTILVVDDEPSVREVTAELVRSLGFAAVEAVDGRDALTKVGRSAGPIRLVLLDLTMPHLDGIQTLRGLHETSPTLPVILMSGYSEHELTRRYGDSGLAGFLQKPFSLDQLVRSLRRALS